MYPGIEIDKILFGQIRIHINIQFGQMPERRHTAHLTADRLADRLRFGKGNFFGTGTGGCLFLVDFFVAGQNQYNHSALFGT